MKSKTFKLFLILSITFLYSSKDAIGVVYPDKKKGKDTIQIPVYKFIPIPVLAPVIVSGSEKVKENKDNNNRKRTRIVYDFNKKKVADDKLIRVKENGEVQVEIKNFNQLRYQLSVQDSSFNIFTSDPDKFLEKISPTKDYPNIELEPKINKKSTNINKIKELKESSTNSYNSYVKLFNALKNINSIYSYACQLDVLNKEYISDLINKKCLEEIFPEESYNIDNVFSEDILTEHDKIYSKIEKTKKEIQDTIEKRENDIKQLDTTKIDEKKTIEAEISILKQIVLPLSELTANVETASRYINESLLKYSQIQNALKTPSYYVSESYRVTKDIHCLNIYKYDINTKKSSKHDKITIELKNALRFSTPSGVFLSGLYDEKFTTVTKETTVETVAVNSSGNSEKLKSNKTYTAMYPSRNRNISFGAMIYISAHTCNGKYTNFGGFLGAGAIFKDNTKIAAAAGGTIILGRNQRCFINIGMATSQVDRLDRPYKTKTFYDINPSSLPISEVWRYSWMVGVAWEIIK